jgi:hypothetical protein
MSQRSFGQNFAEALSSVQLMTENVLLNGRVDLITSMPKFTIPQYQNPNSRNNTYSREATLGYKTQNSVSDLFFSEKNINAIQEGIRYRVYVESNGQFTIDRQSDQELKAVMRSIYLQYGIGSMDCIGQVRSLNARVLQWVVPEVLNNLLQYSRYKQDASTLPMPLERSPLATMKGSRTLEFKSFM